MKRPLPARSAVLALLAGLIAGGALQAQSAQEAKKQANTETMNGTANIGNQEAAASASDQASSPRAENRTARFLLDFVDDQKDLWTSPKDLRFRDTSWLVPLSGISAGLFVTDSDFSRHLSHDPKTTSHYNTLSNAGAAALVAGAGGMWVLSHFNGNNHWRETGFLAGEAAVHSLVMTEALKYSLRRERPYQGDGTGPFFQPGGTSFPSGHSALAWSVASTVAHEYPGPLTKLLAYSAASAVSFSRIRAQKHFPSDVLIGALIGELAAHEIYKKHHDVELGGDTWSSPAHFFYADGQSRPGYVGSPYVPLDSWIYPAIDRLAAMGLIDSAFAGMRPWTRLECVRLLAEAGDRIDAGTGGEEAGNTYRLLEAEFGNELEGNAHDGGFDGRIESVYSRITTISGRPLIDGYYFGQTISDDFGRPYQQGFNSADGFSAWITHGPWVSYFRAEYQHAPSASPLSDMVRQYMFSETNLPSVPPPSAFAAVNRLALLDAYVGLNLRNWQISFGKQSVWWSPMQGGPLLLGNNAEPVNMFRINRVSPFKLPWIFGSLLGPMRLEWFLGQLHGHEFVFRTDTGVVGQFGQPIERQPFIQGQKLSFKPTPNFEFSVATTTVFSGGPAPLTWHYLLKSYSINNGTSTQQGSTSDPGDRRSAFNFSYRVPGLRNRVTFYGDAMTEDEFSPLAYPRKSAFQGGIYLPRLAGISKLDLRIEGGSTGPPDFQFCKGCFYINNRYPDGYTNAGNLLGSPLGRGSQGEHAWSTYWFSARNKVQFSYRHQKMDSLVIPGGGTLNDAAVDMNWLFRDRVNVSGSLQYEQWKYPLLASSAQTNWTTTVQITFFPQFWKK